MLHVLAYVVVIAFPFVVFGIFLLKRAEKKIEELKMRLAVYANANKQYFVDNEELEEKLKCVERDNKLVKRENELLLGDYIQLSKQRDQLEEQHDAKQGIINQLYPLLAAKDKEIEKLQADVKKLEDNTWKLYSLINDYTIEADIKQDELMAAAGKVYYEDNPKKTITPEDASIIKNGSVTTDKLQAASVGFGVDILASGYSLSSGLCTVPYTITPKNKNIAVCSGLDVTLFNKKED